MTRFFVVRMSEALAVLLVMSFVIYGLIGLMPGDPIDLMINSDPKLTPADAARLKALYGLDQPIIERYCNWLTAALGGDLGYSRVHTKPVLDILIPHLWNTVLLLGISLILSLAIAIPLGVYAALKPYSRVDYAVNLFLLCRDICSALLVCLAADPDIRRHARMAAGGQHANHWQGQHR